MFKRAAVLVVSCGAVLAGCGVDPQVENEEIISNLIEAGFPADSIRVSEGAVYMGRDTHVTLEASRELLQPGEGSAELARLDELRELREGQPPAGLVVGGRQATR